MDNIAESLCSSLKAKREGTPPRRPIIFIGHSMGGLVIAKAVTMMANFDREKYPSMYEATTTCIFFGTPFGGADAAATASMWANFGEKVHQAQASKLLELMKPQSEELRNLSTDFMRVAGKLRNSPITLVCFVEEQPTDVLAEASGLATSFGLSGFLMPKTANFVTRDSATFYGAAHRGIGLARNHRNLVKFDGNEDTIWAQIVRTEIKPVIAAASLAVKGRFNATHDIDQGMVLGVLAGLEGAQVEKKRRELSQTFTPSSWISQEKEYAEWLAPLKKLENEEQDQPVPAGKPCLWIRGPEGRGKTSATMAVLQSVEEQVTNIKKLDTGLEPILVAYFFCHKASTDFNTAEDLLKSLIRQLISQNEYLVSYAKIFRRKGKDDTKGSSAQVTVENLWQSLQNMLSDEYLGSRVYFVINNLHELNEDSESTRKLMKFINTDIRNVSNKGADEKRVFTRWFITSRETHLIGEGLTMEGNVRLIDLEDERYGDQVQLELRKHAKKKVDELGIQKKYNEAMTYFASSLIGKRAQNTHWIDMTVVQLQDLSETNSDLKIRRVLERMPRDLKELLNNCWKGIFAKVGDLADELRELLRSMVLTYDDPDDPGVLETELAMLAGLDVAGVDDVEAEREKLHELVAQCRPLLGIEPTLKGSLKVYFINSVVKQHLLENAKHLLGLSDEEIRWQHGVMALRAFSHIQTSFDFLFVEETPEAPAEQQEASGENGEVQGAEGADSAQSETHDDAATHDEGENEDHQDEQPLPDTEQDVSVNGYENGGADDGGDEDEGNQDEEASDDEDNDDAGSQSEWDSEDDNSDTDNDENMEPEARAMKNKAMAYAVKFWLRHASKATYEIAERLSRNDAFWTKDSVIRRRWLIEYDRLMPDYRDFEEPPHKTFTGLHVAATIGFRELVAALIRNGHQEEIDIRDKLNNVPLHYAALFGRVKIVEELLLPRGPDVVIDVDKNDDIKEATPLVFAASRGHIEV